MTKIIYVKHIQKSSSVTARIQKNGVKIRIPPHVLQGIWHPQLSPSLCLRHSPSVTRSLTSFSIVSQLSPQQLPPPPHVSPHFFIHLFKKRRQSQMGDAADQL